MESGHYTCSKARRTSPVSDTPSDVESDDDAPETDTSGPVRLPVTATEELGSMSLQLAEPPSAPPWWRVRTVDLGQTAPSVQGFP